MLLNKHIFTIVDGQTVTTLVKDLATGSWTRVATTTAETKGETSYICKIAGTEPYAAIPLII